MASSGKASAAVFAPVDLARWREAAERDLRGDSFQARLVSRTQDGIEVEPLYTRENCPSVEWTHRSGLAALRCALAQPPSEEAVGAGPGVGAGWDVRQRVADPQLERAAAEVREAIEGGATSLWLVLDRGTKADLDTDAEKRDAELRAQGIVVCTAVDLSRLLEHVPLARVSLALDAGGDALAAGALLVAASRDRGFDAMGLRGSLDCDPLGALTAEGHLPAALDRCLAQMVDLAVWTERHAPQLRAVTVSTLPHQAAGASPAQQVGLALATALAYARAMIDAGQTAVQACGQLSFRFPVGGDVFVEIAKLRAARLAWARVVQLLGGGDKARRMMMHLCSAGCGGQTDDRWVNLLRGTSEAFVGAAADADAITVAPFDDAGGPTGSTEAFGRRIARNTSLVLREEAQLARVHDPAGGSGYVEHLTRRTAELGWELLQQIERAGGMARALTSGLVADRLAGASVDPQPTSATAEGSTQGDGTSGDWAPGEWMRAAIEAASAGATLGQISARFRGQGEPATMTPLPRTPPSRVRDEQELQDLPGTEDSGGATP